jgi:hypothetical protein
MPGDPQTDMRAFFAAHAGAGALSRHLQSVDPATRVRWESLSASDYSPGCVQNTEHLARQVLDPVYFDQKSGEVKPTLFDDASSRGASVNRMDHLQEADLHALGRTRAEQSTARSTVPKTYMGFVCVRTDAVRALQHEDQGMKLQAFGVYDTAHGSDPSHADICQLVAAGKMIGRSLRTRLFQLSKNSFHRPDPA